MPSFSDHVALLGEFLDRRREIADRIEGRLLNAQGKETSRRRDRPFFDQTLGACFFGLSGLPDGLVHLRGQLQAQHLADGFEPVVIDRHANELDPLDLVIRAYERWDQSRWPGKSGRLTYAATICDIFLLRQIEQLTLRIWDDGSEGAEGRLQEVQRMLDRLNSPPNARVFVRDARWLMQTAQGPLTRHIRPYFTIADHIAESLTEEQRLEVHKAGAKLAGGHLRSQLQYREWHSGEPADNPEVVAFSRASNALDLALLVRDLTPLLEAYKTARAARDADAAVDLADAILQGCSADPELCLTRLDLVGPHTMIEDLFIERGADGRARHTAVGEAHVRMLERYCGLVGELAESLREDAAGFNPRTRAYSPYGVVYGFVADLLANMALDALVSQPSFGLSLEDVFAGRGHEEHQLARAHGWQRLPQRTGEREHFVHSPEWAAATFARLTHALEMRASRPTSMNASEHPDGKLFVVEGRLTGEPPRDGVLSIDTAPAQEYCLTSDLARALAGAGIAQSHDEMITERTEGRFLASAETDGKWFGVSKLVLTMVLGQGRHARIAGAPPEIIEVLRLTCPALLAHEDGLITGRTAKS